MTISNRTLVPTPSTPLPQVTPMDKTNSEDTESVCLITPPLTSNIVDFLLGEIWQAGILVSLRPDVVINSGSHFRWIVPRNAVDGMGEQPEVKQKQVMTISGIAI